MPVTQVKNQYQLGRTGQPVEYALKMRQFPQEALLLVMFEQGQLGETHMEELGRVVAEYHGKAQTNNYIRAFGEVAQVRAAIDENYEQTKKYIGGPQTQA